MEFTFYLLLTKIEIYFCFFNFFKLFMIFFERISKSFPYFLRIFSRRNDPLA